MKVLGVGDNAFDIEKAEYYNMVNHMKMGIIYSDLITTISKCYAEEIQKRDFVSKQIVSIICSIPLFLYDYIPVERWLK